MTDVAAVVHLALVGAVFWSVVCRARLMDAETSITVRVQHGALNAAALFSLAPMPDAWRAPIFAAGVAVFLLLSAPGELVK